MLLGESYGFIPNHILESLHAGKRGGGEKEERRREEKGNGGEGKRGEGRGGDGHFRNLSSGLET